MTPTTTQMLDLLRQKYPTWLTRHGNAHRAIEALNDPQVNEQYGLWAMSEAGQRLLANREKWEHRWVCQLAAKGRDLRDESRVERETVAQSAGPTILHSLGAAIQHRVEEGY